MDVNLLDGAWYAGDPHAIWSWMRAEAPVYRDERSRVWGIARYEDVLRIEKDPARELCTTILDAVCEQGECDFVWDVAAPLPLLLIADMLGFESDSHDDLLRWSDDLLRATTASPPPDVARTALDAMLGFRQCQLDVIAQRRTDPRDDLISTLCHATVDGERLPDLALSDPDALVWRESNFVSGLGTMAVRFTPTERVGR